MLHYGRIRAHLGLSLHSLYILGYIVQLKPRHESLVICVSGILLEDGQRYASGRAERYDPLSPKANGNSANRLDEAAKETMSLQTLNMSNKRRTLLDTFPACYPRRLGKVRRYLDSVPATMFCHQIRDPSPLCMRHETTGRYSGALSQLGDVPILRLSEVPEADQGFYGPARVLHEPDFSYFADAYL